VEPLFQPVKPFITYFVPWTWLFIGMLWAVDQQKLRFEPLIAVLSALVALILLIDVNKPLPDYALSGGLIVFALATPAYQIYKNSKHKKDRNSKYKKNRRVWAPAAVAAVYVAGGIALFWYYYPQDIRDVTIKVILSTEPSPGTIDAYRSAEWEQHAAESFMKKTGAKVEIITADPDPTVRLEDYLKRFEPAHGKDLGDVDVFAIDVVWPGVMAKYAENLTPIFGDLGKDFIPALVKNNTVGEKLIAVPWYTDAGLLFYRRDLLDKYGFKNPPETWNELEDMAKKIQEGERATGNPNFWGFVWQGKDYEGLTCNALEWQASHGGGTIVSEKGVPTVDNPNTIAALKRASGWINTIKISPKEVLTFGERESLKVWTDGNAAFMRNWPFAYGASQRVSWHNNIGVTLLPKGPDPDDPHASTLGGWQLMVNAHSKGKEKTAAIEFVRFLTDKDNQVSLAVETSKPPTRAALYEPGKVLKELPFLADVKFLQIVKGGGVTRPSTATAEKYPEVSKAYSAEVHLVLEGRKEAERAVKDLEIKLK
jgi:trehalose/maltose transport system substrate-binding protein